MSNYGPVDILWWDFSSKDFQGDEAWRATDLMKMVRAKQPRIIVNNRLYSAHTTNAGAAKSTRNSPLTAAISPRPSSAFPRPECRASIGKHA